MEYWEFEGLVRSLNMRQLVSCHFEEPATRNLKLFKQFYKPLKISHICSK
jgi:hypothetical protein